ncbi:polyprenol monophosphomannose synthase [Haloactinopolyspora sp.]|uniref:polyprenol monophosphomannose synthase n=1 Tax=Haloactinopolyspora sp. TaxID=1966353 RepID=UPI00260F22BF|nr:polyprenol monophosphomannose synthase [Haloactinopolyspora sp.]
MNVLVVVPTYNEALTIGKAIERTRSAVPEAHLLVVDDSSPDGTGAIVDEIAELDDHVNVLHRPGGKQGLGAAYINGFRWGLERGFDILVEMDADGSHQPEELPRLLHAAEQADLVLGSRYVPGGQVVNWPWRREALSRAGNLYARLALGTTLRDATGGFRAYRAEALRTLDLDGVASQGYCFQVDMAWRVQRAGLRIIEVPITFVEREQGESKMDSTIVREAFWRILRWGASHRAAQMRAWRDGQAR